MGCVEYEREVLQLRIDKIRDIAARLPLIRDLQVEYAILRSCLAIPLRTTNPLLHQDMWMEFDSIIRESLCLILGTTLTQQQWDQACLAAAEGGLGLRASSDHSCVTYITSCLSSQDLKLQILSRNVEDCPPVITADLLQGMQEKTVREDTVASLQETTQREVSLAVDLSSAISEQGSTIDKAKMGSLGLSNAGAWPDQQIFSCQIGREARILRWT